MELLSSLPEFAQVPPPFLLNGLKHHIGVLAAMVSRCEGSEGEEVLSVLAHEIKVLGNGLMDMYHGDMQLSEVFAWARGLLEAEEAFAEDAYRAWIASTEDNYATITAVDGTDWILYPTDVEDRYIHIHPARHTPNTSRIRGKVLKSAVLVVASARLHGHEPFDVQALNDLRVAHLNLSPIKEIEEGGGLHVAIQRLLHAMDQLPE